MAGEVVIQADGKIVICGTAATDFLLVRFNANGSLDLTFDTDGVVTTDFGSSNDSCTGLAMQSDGMIVAAGVTGAGATDFALARYTTIGNLDPTFDGDGKTTTNILGVDAANGVAIQTDGKIVAAGTAV